MIFFLSIPEISSIKSHPKSTLSVNQKINKVHEIFYYLDERKIRKFQSKVLSSDGSFLILTNAQSHGSYIWHFNVF